MYETSDIGVAAYLMFKEIKLKDCSVSSSGRFYFKFEDPHGIASELAMEFLNSEFSRFDDKMRTLRKMLKFNPKKS